MSGGLIHRKAVCFLLVGVPCLFYAPVSAQSTSLCEVQAVVGDLRNAHQAHSVDVLLLAQPGVVMCRTDHNTRNLFMHVRPDSQLTEEQVRQLLMPLSLSLSCYRRVPLSDLPFAHLDPRDCHTAEPVR